MPAHPIDQNECTVEFRKLLAEMCRQKKTYKEKKELAKKFYESTDKLQEKLKGYHDFWNEGKETYHMVEVKTAKI
jgi:hypothetical protein